jgi:hypothetical protein
MPGGRSQGGPWWKSALFGVALFAILFPLVSALVLSESSVRIPRQLRVTPQAALAEAIAKQAGGKWREAEIRAQDQSVLRAWLFEPAVANGGVVIILHGVGDSRRGSAPMADIFLRHGYRVLVPDSRGHGTSEGELVTYGLREKDDMRGWVDWLYAHVSPRALYGLGESMGAAILLQALAVEPRIRAAVAESGFADFHQVAYDRLAGRFGLPRAIFAPVIEPGLFYVRQRYGIDLTEARPGRALLSVKTPVFFIHGTEDRNIPPAHSRQLYRMRPANSQLWQPKGAWHTAAAHVYPQEFERRVIEWFRRHP